MNFNPVHYGTVLIDKHDILLDKNRLLIGIDHGRLLTKVVFLNKNNKSELIDESLSKFHLDYGIFEVDDFPKVLSWLKDQVYIQENVDNLTIPCSGVGCSKYKKLTESVFGIKVQLIKDDVSSIAGLKYGLEHIGIDALIAPKIEVKMDVVLLENDMLAKFIESQNSRKKPENESGLYPCFIVDIGSRTKFIWFDENGRSQTYDFTVIDGITFAGLMKCIVDTNNYKEYVQLAEKGDRCKVDTQVKELIDDLPDNPYGQFPPDLPVFSFGKCMDHNIGLGEFTKDDAAASLVIFLLESILMTTSIVNRYTQTKKVRLLGNLFESKVFHKGVTEYLSVYPNLFDVDILNFGYYGALGTMIADGLSAE